MTYGGIKNYTLVHLSFKDGKFEIYDYKKDRRLTAKQAWKFIYDNEPTISGVLSNHATIDDYSKIIETYKLDEKHCDRYMTFRGFN